MMTKQPGNSCSFCGRIFSKQLSRCPRCKTLATSTSMTGSATRLLSEVSPRPIPRIKTGPWDICWGPANGKEPNGIAETSCTLLGGKRGGGKSTLLLQIADAVAKNTGRETLHICTEEDIEQVRDAAHRIGVCHLYKIRAMSTLNGTESFSQLEGIISEFKPALIGLDSIPGLMGPDRIGAIELCKLMKSYSMKLRAPSILIDHVNKDGDFAGLEELQHTPDTCITLFPIGDESSDIRELQVEKNRFGKAFVTCALEMTEKGLVPYQDDNPDESPSHVSHDD